MKKKTYLQKFLFGAVIGGAVQLLLMCVVFVPFYAIWGFSPQGELRQNYATAFMNMKEIIAIFTVASAILWGIKEAIRPDSDVED